MSIAAAFPTRPLTLTSPLRRESIWELTLSALLLLALGLGLVNYLGPEILRDAGIGADYRLDADGRVAVEGSCEQDWVIATCSLSLEADNGGAHQTFFIFLRTGHPANIDTRAGVAASGALVVAGAQQAIANRMLTLAAFLAFCAGIIALCVLLARRRRVLTRTQRAMQAAKLMLLEVVIEKIHGGGDRPLEIAYRRRQGGSRVRAVFPADFEPLAIGLALDRAPNSNDPRPILGRPLALAVSPASGGAAVLLDRKLASLDLSADERDALLRAIA